MSFSGWLIAGAVFIIILTIAIGIGWWLRNNNTPTPAPPNPYSAPLVWGQPTAGPDSDKNFCQLYEFPTGLVTINNVPTAVPGVPTFNPEILNDLQGRPNYPSCLDSDQIMAQQVQHVCTAPNGVVDGGITRCFLINGGLTGLGGTESYYTNDGCFKVASCAGQLALISINFQAPGPTGYQIPCIQNNGTGANVTMQPCNPSLQQQLFRITRINPGQNPNSLQPGQAQNGLIAQILDRNSGLCLNPGTGTFFTNYDSSVLHDTNCTGGGQVFIGTNVVMSQCTGGQFPGYSWMLMPSISFCDLPSGCQGCTGCNGCNRLIGSNECGGCAGCTGRSGIPTPPQIVYVGNLNLNTIPTGATAYNGLTGASAIYQWLIDNNAQSLYYGGTGIGLILLPVSGDVTICTNRPYTAQYMNLTTYNTISEEQVCIQEFNTTSCIGL